MFNQLAKDSEFHLVTGARLAQSQCPFMQCVKLVNNQSLNLLINQVTIFIKTTGKGVAENFRFVEQVEIEKYTDLAQVVLGARGSHSTAGPHDRGRFSSKKTIIWFT